MENYSEIIRNFVLSIQELVHKAIRTADFDKTFHAIVIEKKASDKYEIEYKGKRYNARCKTPIEIGSIVTVCAPQNKWNELYIQCDEVFYADQLKEGNVLNAINQLKEGYGQCGSVHVTACTYQNVSIPGGWYNFLWIPHRHGGTERDNSNYGTLTLYPMNMTGNVYVIQYSQRNISMVKVL